MAKKTDLKPIIAKIKLFKHKLDQEGYKNAKYVLFGSWAKGKVHAWSDIDFCVISPLFKDRYDDSVKLKRLASDIDPLLEPVVLFPEDLNDKYYTLAAEIKACGITLNL